MSTNAAAQAFKDLDLSPEEFRKLGYQAVDMMADYYATIRDLPVFPPNTAAEVAEVFREPLPQKGQDPSAILREWKHKVLPYASHLGSPRYFGFVNGSGTMIGALAEALAATVNMNPGGWKAAPSATEIERLTIAWIAELIGYPASCGGLFTSGGTMANFTALNAALRNTASYDTTKDGLQKEGFTRKFRIYMADHEGHVSITRAADLMNLGREAVRLVRSGEDFTMDAAALEAQLDKDRANGDFPFCVVAQVGSINVGAIDPLEAIAEICRKRGIWFHADGACGAVGAILPEKKTQFRGLELADSVTLDPHKWLYIPYECGCVLLRDAEKMRRAFSMTAPYLHGSLATEHTGMYYLDYGPQMSRGFRALKVWMSLKHYGVEGYRSLLSQNVACVEHLDRLVRASEDFQALHRPNLHIYSFRYAPVTVKESLKEDSEALDSKLDHLNQEIADAIQLSGKAFVMTTRIHGRVVLRLSVCSHRTTLADIDRVFDKLRALGEGLQTQV